MKICILGGGLTGMAAAYELSDSNEVVIIEKEDLLGGLASSFEKGAKWIPRYYHHIFMHDDVTKAFMEKFGIKLKFNRIDMAILVNGKVYDFADPISLFGFDYLSLWGRIRYGLFGAYVFTFMNPDRIKEDMNAEEWLMKHAGKEVTNKLFYELYAVNKFGIPLGQISAKQFANRLKAKEAIGKFAYPECGLQEFLDRFERFLDKRKVKIMKNCEVNKIKEGEIYFKRKKKSRSEKIKCDLVINTLPIPVFLRAIQKLPKHYIERLSKIKYCPAICITYGSDKRLTHHYWINVLKENCHMIMQHSVLFDGYDDEVGWVLRYGGSGEDFELSSGEIKEKYLGVIRKYFPGVKFKWSIVSKDRYAEPIYDKNYTMNKPDYKSPFRWLYHAGISVTYPEIRNMNTALKSGLKVAYIIKEDLKNRIF